MELLKTKNTKANVEQKPVVEYKTLNSNAVTEAIQSSKIEKKKNKKTNDTYLFKLQMLL